MEVERLGGEGVRRSGEYLAAIAVVVAMAAAPSQIV